MNGWPTSRAHPRTLYGANGAFTASPQYAHAVHRYTPLFTKAEKVMVGLAIVVTVLACLGAFV